MIEIILQYLLVIFLVVAVAYLIYLLKDKDNIESDNLFNLEGALQDIFDRQENTSENIKKLLRIVSVAIQYVEINFRHEDNAVKEEKALLIAKEELEGLNFKSNIDDEVIRYLIRIGCAILPPTNN